MSQTTTVAESCVMLDLGFSLWGLVRKVKRAEVDVQAADGAEVPEEALRLSKRLLKCEEYDRVVKADGETRRRVQALALPFGSRTGVYVVPVTLVERVVAMLQEREAVRDAEVDAFVAVYDAAVDQAREHLGPLFKAEDYPPRETVREAFRMRWHFVEMSAAGKLKEISQAMYEREQTKLRDEWDRAAETMRDSMRAAFEQLVASLRERLDGNREGGKPKIFRDSRVESLKEWIGLFSARNVVSDEELSSLVERAERLLDGVTASELREDAYGRARTAAALKEIEDGVKTLCVADAPRRKFKLEEDAA